MKHKSTFAARLRALRTQAGLSAYALAKASEVSKQTISNLEAGKVKPSWVNACKLADALSVSLDAFRTP